MDGTFSGERRKGCVEVSLCASLGVDGRRSKACDGILSVISFSRR